jgi:hypothetical protein
MTMIVFNGYDGACYEMFLCLARLPQLPRNVGIGHAARPLLSPRKRLQRQSKGIMNGRLMNGTLHLMPAPIAPAIVRMLDFVFAWHFTVHHKNILVRLHDPPSVLGPSILNLIRVRRDPVITSVHDFLREHTYTTTPMRIKPVSRADLPHPAHQTSR